MDVALSKLEQLSAIAQCGSFSRAAEMLRISQPALSRSIAALERRCGFRIFDRIGHGVEPTEAGRQLLAQAEPLLLSMRVFESNVGLLASGRAGALRFGLPPLLASQMLPQLAEHFFSRTQRVELRTSIRRGPILLEELRNNAIEFFLFSESQVETGPEVERISMGAIQPICVVRAEHPLAGRIGLTSADLGDYPWGSSVEPPAMGLSLNSARFLCDNYHVLRETALRTDLIFICTAAFVADDMAAGRLCALDTPDFLPPTTAVYLAKVKDRIFSPLAEEAITYMRRLLGQHDVSGQ